MAIQLPKGINLKNVDCSPFVKKDKRTNLVRFNSNEIRVSGETKNYRTFNAWFNSLKKLEWVSKIEVLGYQEKNNGHQAEFTFNIIVEK